MNELIEEEIKNQEKRIETILLIVSFNKLKNNTYILKYNLDEHDIFIFQRKANTINYRSL